MRNLIETFFDINVFKQEIEDIKQKIESKDDDLIKLKELVLNIASQEKLKYPNLPIDNTGHLDMDEYVKQQWYSRETVDGDKDTIRQLESKWLTEITPYNKIEYVEKKINSEKVEILTMITLYKFLKNDFLIVRSARYDDIDNSVDTIIFDKQTGEIVCTLDESGAFFGQYAEKKRLKTLEKNEKGGARLKYGLILMKNSDGQDIIKGGQVKNIPLFDLLINFSDINKYFPELTNNLKDISEFERNLFIYFIKVINSQLKEMQDPLLKIPSIIKQSGQNFISKILKLYPNILYSDSLADSKNKGLLSPEFYTFPKKITNSQERDTFRKKARR